MSEHTSDGSAPGCKMCGERFPIYNLVINGALAVVKGVIGLLAASQALMASALYSINDMLSTITVIVSLRIAKRSPDDNHPYGHGKAEFVAIGVVSVILATAILLMLAYSLWDIIRGASPPSLIALPVAIASAVITEFLARRGYCAADRLGSVALATCAKHNRADTISSVATVIGVSGALVGLHFLDPLVAVFETLHIIWLSGELFGHSLKGLMDSALPLEQIERIEAACAAVDGVERVARIRSRRAGPLSMVDVEIAVADDLLLDDAEAIAVGVRSAVQQLSEGSLEVQVKVRPATEVALVGLGSATRANV